MSTVTILYLVFCVLDLIASIGVLVWGIRGHIRFERRWKARMQEIEDRHTKYSPQNIENMTQDEIEAALDEILERNG